MVGREAQNSGLFERNSLPPKTGNWPARTREAFWNNGECFRRSRERRCGCFPEGCPLENIQRPTRQPSAWVCYQKATGRARLRYRPAGTSTFELHGDLIARSSDPRHWPSNAWQQYHRYSAILLPEPLRTSGTGPARACTGRNRTTPRNPMVWLPAWYSQSHAASCRRQP